MSARLALAILLAVLVAGPVVAGPTSINGEHDIGVLLAKAREVRDLDAEDAVFLLDELREDWTADGRRIHSVHRIVYVRTGYAIRQHADLRIPYDVTRQEFAVAALRTWRLSDERWIASGPTAQVETLPFALDRAPDYQQRREMMLLHDGVELPCVMETAYSIEDKEPYRAGASGLWTVQRDEPAIVSRFVLGSAPGPAPTWAGIEGAPDPVRGRDVDRGLDTLTFEAGPTDALPYPRGTAMMEGVPRIVWSTWKDWPALGADLQERFDAALEIDDDLRAAWKEHAKDARTLTEKLGLIADFVGDATRLIDYEIGWWPGPRGAARTWATAYGNGIDRAALAAALYREAGFDASLVFVGRPAEVEEWRVPAMNWTDGPGVAVRGEGLQGTFDPSDASFARGMAELTGRGSWQPRIDREPSVPTPLGDKPSEIDLVIDLHFDEEAGSWTGTGVLTATHALCPFDRMAGLGNESLEYLGHLASSVMPGAEVNAHNVAIFDRAHVEVGFEMTVPAGEPDALGRLRLELAAPGEVAALLAGSAVHVYEEERGSGIDLPTPVEQRVELRLDPGDLQTVLVPEARTLDNPAGRFEIASVEEEDSIRLTRHLVLAKDRYAAAEWPDVRALLLADGHQGSRIILLKRGE